ncbi:glycerol uptake facilitator protein [Dothidotthia symphoricarpi CBS 119687]|uniref:Glycerol uptake facilitator protein n=1 Tax=Dothidotthia symphoricarpi CBS 119687 TaxID=1392245 RepID=A0A6A6ALG9_9PLEO|nr:glycerol uptake facilitator protein [Dothidotthia symphoricarpi CBS 119687]KAF2131301.1 glycerol uptake facilitator protein [Dothidotthia symphoricarpi CBS 119687]
MSRTNTTQTNGTQDSHYRAEKKQEQMIDVDNDYFALNPWYNQQKDKPVFGLAAPLPHTLRKGMWWGKGDLRKSLYKVDEEKNDDGVARQDGLDFEEKTRQPAPSGGASGFNGDYFTSQNVRTGLDDESDGSQGTIVGEPGSQDPDRFQTTIHGRRVNVRRLPTAEADEVLGNRHQNHESQDHESQDHRGHPRAPVNEHGLTENQGNGTQRGQFGLQDGLHPLKEVGTHETSETQKEKHRVEQREHEAQKEYYDRYRNPIARLRAQYPQAPAEFLATFVYLFLGLTTNLSIATSQNTTGSFETQAWGWGFAVMIGIYMAGGTSGAHLSPCVSICLFVYRGFPWRMAVLYICVQMLAGLAAGALAFALYRDAIYAVDPGLTLEITGSAIFPKGPAFSTVTGFFNDFVYMAVWICITFALGDDQNSPPGQGMTALIFGFAGYLTMVALGYNTGLGISPARDLGPRLVALWVGYDDAFKGGYWAYGPWCASISGALFGGFIYDLLIFVGGESPVNYRWPQPGDIKWKVKEKKEQTKDKIQGIA